jgi:hypothetical protein
MGANSAPTIRRTITLLNAVDCVAEAGVEAELTLTEQQRSDLAQASCYCGVSLRVLIGTLVGSPSFVIDGLQYSIDGTNWATLPSIVNITVTAAGEKAIVLLTDLIPAAVTKLRLSATVTTLTAGNHCPVTAQLYVEA